MFRQGKLPDSPAISLVGSLLRQAFLEQVSREGCEGLWVTVGESIPVRQRLGNGIGARGGKANP